ncbi:hypothetical protein [Saccharothrix lopnurensis]|uniref:Uncharacterized protein n=1 Tax=Saccharothrix lopnurensis TaxID=1670621 RepID=A0ABW1P0U7_9PSEU
MKKMPKLGERVRVPFGGSMHEGEVVRTSDFGIGPLVFVAVEIEGADEPLQGMYELEYVEPVSAA